MAADANKIFTNSLMLIVRITIIYLFQFAYWKRGRPDDGVRRVARQRSAWKAEQGNESEAGEGEAAECGREGPRQGHRDG